MQVPELTVTDLVDLARGRRLSTFVGAAHGVPAAIVEVGDDPSRDPVGGIDPDGELELLPAVLIGVGRERSPAPAFVDVVVEDAASGRQLAERVGQAPLASTSLALLLRGGAWRGVAGGLVSESTAYSMLQGSGEFRAWRATRPVRPRPSTTAADEAVGSGMRPPVRVEHLGSLTQLVLDRPGRHNAFDAATAELVVATLTDALAADHPGPVVLRGEGPSFCSGGDLDEFGTFPDPAAAHAIRLARSAGHLVHLLRDRMEVRLHGACIGAGIEVPAFAGRVVAAPDTRIALPEVSLGLIPGAGGTVSLPRRIGRHRTMELALHDGAIDAATALAWGLVDAIVEQRS